MINNEFILIGICTSNYENIGNGKWKSYIFRMEIEKFGSQNGNTFEIELQVYANNKAVDTSKEIIGKQVVVNGYIDNYLTTEGRIITKLIVQRVYLLGEQQLKVNAEADSGFGLEESADVISLPTSSNVDDDDLPF